MNQNLSWFDVSESLRHYCWWTRCLHKKHYWQNSQWNIWAIMEVVCGQDSSLVKITTRGCHSGTFPGLSKDDQNPSVLYERCGFSLNKSSPCSQLCRGSALQHSVSSQLHSICLWLNCCSYWLPALITLLLHFAFHSHTPDSGFVILQCWIIVFFWSPISSSGFFNC